MAENHGSNVVVLGFYVPPTAKGHTETGPRFKSHQKDLEVT